MTGAFRGDGFADRADPLALPRPRAPHARSSRRRGRRLRWLRRRPRRRQASPPGWHLIDRALDMSGENRFLPPNDQQCPWSARRRSAFAAVEEAHVAGCGSGRGLGVADRNGLDATEGPAVAISPVVTVGGGKRPGPRRRRWSPRRPAGGNRSRRARARPHEPPRAGASPRRRASGGVVLRARLPTTPGGSPAAGSASGETCSRKPPAPAGAIEASPGAQRADGLGHQIDGHPRDERPEPAAPRGRPAQRRPSAEVQGPPRRRRRDTAESRGASARGGGREPLGAAMRAGARMKPRCPESSSFR